MGVTHTTDDYHGICGAFRICKSLYGKMVWHEFLSPKKMMLTDKAGTIFFRWTNGRRGGTAVKPLEPR